MPKLCVMPGDGIGQEVIPAAVTISQAALPDLEIVEAEAGWGCFEKHGASVLSRRGGRQSQVLPTSK